MQNAAACSPPAGQAHNQICVTHFDKNDAYFEVIIWPKASKGTEEADRQLIQVEFKINTFSEIVMPQHVR